VYQDNVIPLSPQNANGNELLLSRPHASLRAEINVHALKLTVCESLTLNSAKRVIAVKFYIHIMFINM